MNEDALVKLGLQTLLGDFVTIHTQYPVQPPAQFVDVFVATRPDSPEAMANTLGWLGRMACGLTLLEAFTSDVSVADARHCLRKQLTLHHALELEAEAQRREGKDIEELPLPWLWLLTWSHPRVLLRDWGLQAVQDWPTGFYQAAPGLAVGVVVLPELPRTRDTLPLRMFGDDEVRQGLRAEFDALGADDPMRHALDRMLVCWSLWVRGQPQDEALRRWLMNFNQVVQQEIQKLKDEGRREALQAVQQEIQKLKEEGRLEGEANGLRAAISDLCELMDIKLGEERRAHLASLDLAGLQALRAHLKQHHAWPAD